MSRLNKTIPKFLKLILLVSLIIIPINQANAAFSGTNGKIIFLDTKPNSYATFNTVNPDGSDQQTIIIDLAAATDPAWSPDGTNIAFSGVNDLHDAQDGYRIYTISADGSDQRKITTNNSRPAGDFNDCGFIYKFAQG